MKFQIGVFFEELWEVNITIIDDGVVLRCEDIVAIYSCESYINSSSRGSTDLSRKFVFEIWTRALDLNLGMASGLVFFPMVFLYKVFVELLDSRLNIPYRREVVVLIASSQSFWWFRTSLTSASIVIDISMSFMLIILALPLESVE